MEVIPSVFHSRFLIPLLRRFALQGGALILVKYHPLDHIPGLGIDRMSNVAVLPICRLTAWHCDKQAFLSLDHFDIMDHELVIQGDRNDSFHLSLFLDSSYSYICNLHLVPLSVSPL